MNPKKVYLLDTGFSFLPADFSENKGKMLENIVAIELLRRQEEVYYYKNRLECDFLLKRGTKPELAIQVCWELTAKNQEREFRGLAEAVGSLKIPEGIVLTYSGVNSYRTAHSWACHECGRSAGTENVPLILELESGGHRIGRRLINSPERWL